MKKNILILTCKVVVAILIGAISFFIASVNKKQAKITDDVAKYETKLLKAPTDKAPLDHKPEDVIAYILYNVKNTKNFKVKTTGNVSASIATLKVLNERVVIGNEAMVSTISSGLISSTKQKFYSNDKVLIRDREKMNDLDVTWKMDAPECITYNEMIYRYGWLPWQANGYIICDETYINKDKLKVEKLDNDLYKVAFDLNPSGDYAPFWYRREVLTTSASTMIPDFKAIHIEFTFDKNYKLIYQNLKEAYYVETIGIKALAETNLRDEFTYDNIEFNKEYKAYFDQYKDLKPIEDKKEPLIKEDNATILVKSLQKENESSLYDINAKIADKEIKGNLVINIKDLENIDLRLKIDNYLELELFEKNIYLSLLGINLKGSTNDLANIISKFTNNSKSLNLNDSLAKVNDGKLEIDGNIKKLSFSFDIFNSKLAVTAVINKTDTGYSLIEANASFKLLNKDINIKVTQGNKKFEPKDYTNYKNIKDLDNIIDKLIDIINKDTYSLKLDLSLLDKDNKYLDINGKVNLKLYKENDFDLELSSTIKKYEGSKDKTYLVHLKVISKSYYKEHNIESDSMVFIEVGSLLETDSKLRIKMPLNNIYCILDTVLKVLDININTLSKYNQLKTEDIDLTNFKNLIHNLVSNIKLNFGINELVKEFNINNDIINLKLKTNNNTDTLTNVIIDFNNKDNIIAKASLENLYINYYSNLDNLKLNISELSLIDEIVKIDLDNQTYYDFKDIDKLVNSLIATASLRDFDISTKVEINMSIFGASIKGEIPVSIKVKVDDKGKPIIHFSINLENLGTLLKSFIPTDKLDIYYKDGFIYLNRVESKNKDVYKIKVTAKTFLGNIKYYLVEYGIGLLPGLFDSFGASGKTDKQMNIGNILKAYSFKDNKFNIKLNLQELLGNSLLGDIEFNLVLSETKVKENANSVLAITKVENISTKIMSILEVKINEVKLNNISDKGVTPVDMSALESYISGYHGDIDIAYINNENKDLAKHKITFVMGIEKNVIFEGKVNDNINFPENKVIEYNGKKYQIEGYYTDRELKNKFDGKTVSNDDLKLYVKYKEVA